MSSIWTIRRSATDTKVSGLCGGIARQWGVDPVLIRLAFALLALSGGIGVVLYLAGWLLVPVEGKSEALVGDVLGGQFRRWPRPLWLILVVGCAILASAALKDVATFGVGPAIVLALVWYFGYYRHRSTARHSHRRSSGAGPLPPQAQVPPPAPVPPQPGQFYSQLGPATPFTDAAAGWREGVVDTQRLRDQPGAPAGSGQSGPGGENLREPVGLAADISSAPGQRVSDPLSDPAFLATPDPVGLYVQPDAPAGSTALVPPRRSGSRSARRLRLVALVAVGLALSGLALANALGATVPVPTYFAATLLVLGLTLVAAARFGRARGILPVALLVMLATIASTIGEPVADGRGWQDEPVRYSATQLPRSDVVNLGELRVDLTELRPTSDTSYTAHVGTGRLEVKAPATANVVINWSAKTGVLMLNGDEIAAGPNVSDVQQPVSRDPRKRTLTLNLSVDRGIVEVRR